MKNMHREPHHSIKKTWVMVLFIFFTLFLVGSVSAFEWDNVKSYDSKTKKITVINALGLGSDISTIQLTTPTNYNAPRGYQKVAEFKLVLFENYTTAFKELELYDLNKNNNKFIRSYDYKVLSYEKILVNDYAYVFVGFSGNGTEIYESQVVGTHQELREKWTNLVSKDFNDKDNFTIGIFTNVQKGDYVEWIPNFFGVRIDEWATWTESLNVDIVSYYKLDNNNLSDSLGLNDGTNGDTINSSGIIKDGREFNGTSPIGSFINLGPMNIHTQMSVSAWTNTDSNDSTHVVIGENPVNTKWLLLFSAPGEIIWRTVNTDVSCPSPTNSEWHHIVATSDGTDARIYIDGVSCVNGTGDTIVNGVGNVNIGRYETAGFFDGKIDEIGIWNRTLSQSEVTQLYNGGNAITWRGNFNIPTVTLNAPINSFNTTNSTIIFNGTVVSGIGIINVTLFIDGILNETNSSGINDTDYLFTKIIAEGNHNWTYESCNDDGCTTATTRTFLIDATNPFINITRPLSIISYHEVNTNLTINWTVSDLNLDVCILEFEGVNRTVTCLDNSTEINITNNVNKTVTFYANDTLGNSNSTSKSWNYTIFQHSLIYELSTIGGSTEDFKLNVTKDSSLQISKVDLVYNLSASTATFTSGDNPIISKSLDIPNPGSDINFSFYFSFTLSDSQIINTSSKNQTVLNFAIGNCSIFTVLIYNFTLLDEENQTQLSNVTIDYAFNLFDNSRTTQIINFSLSSTVNPTAICVNQNLTTSSFSLDGILKYISTDSPNYLTRYYNILNFSLRNSSIPNDINLYDVIDTTATPFQITFRNNFLVLSPNILVNVNKQYVSTNDFKTVEIPITDTNGQTILNLVRDVGIYNLIFIDIGGNIVATFNKINAFCQDFTIGECRLNLDSTSTITKTFDLEEAIKISYTLEYVNSTSIATLNFNSINSTPVTLRIVGTTQNQFGNQTVCDNSLTSTLGTLTCNASSILVTDNYLFIDIFSDGNYVATRIININPSNPLIGGLYGTNGYFIAFFMLLLIIILFSDDKQVLLIMLGMGWVAILIFGLIRGAIIGSVSAGIWLLVSIITMIWKLKQEEEAK